MKKIVWLFICCVLMVKAADSQEVLSGLDDAEWRFGFTVNPNIGFMSPDNKLLKSDEIRAGLSYGLIVDYLFGKNRRYAIASGAQVTLTNSVLKGQDSDGLNTSTITAHLNYFEIPISLKLRSNEMNSTIFYGQMGFVPAVLVRSRVDYAYTGERNDSEDNVKFSELPFYPNQIDRAALVNVGISLEAGIEYLVGDEIYLIGGLFFNNGFFDIIKDNDDERVVSRNIGLRVGILF